MERTIQLIDFQTGMASDYQFDAEDTILDLKRKVAIAEQYDDDEWRTKVQIFWVCFPLKDTDLVKDFVDKEEGVFVHFEDYPIECKADGDIFVWLGKRKCIKLYSGATETIEIPRNGHFAVMRSK